MISFMVDEITPCLKSNETGEIYETEVIQLKRKSFLTKFNKRTGWYVNWSRFEDGIEIYALVLKGTMDIQGLIAIQNDSSSKSIHIVWACTAPWNNKLKTSTPKYSGVGGHLLAIASELSIIRGFDGYIWGEAINKDIFKYYLDQFSATAIPTSNNPYRFMISGKQTQKLMEVYNYEWTGEEL